MIQNVDNFLFGYFTGRHNFLRIMKTKNTNTLKLCSKTLASVNTPKNHEDNMEIDEDSGVLFQTISVAIRDIILSIIPQCFRNSACVSINTNTMTQFSSDDYKTMESKHLQTFEDFLSICRYVGERLMTVIIDGLTVKDFDTTLLTSIISHDELTSDEISAYIEATDRAHNKYTKTFHKLSESGTNTLAKHCIIRRFMINLIKIGIMRSLYDFVENPELTSTSTWGIIDVSEFVKEMRHIVDREIKQGNSNHFITKVLTRYYSSSLLNISQIIQPKQKIIDPENPTLMDIDWKFEKQSNDDEFMEPVDPVTESQIPEKSIQIPHKIRDLIQKFISENQTIKLCFDMFDSLFSKVYKNYHRVRSEVKSSLYLVIFLLIWNIKLKGDIKIKFMSDETVIKGIVPTINTVYLNPITDMMNNLNEYTNFMNVYEDTLYPPVFLTKSATISFNSLFQKVYDDHDNQIDLQIFREKFNTLVHKKVGYLSDMIIKGIDYASTRNIDVVANLYERCKENQNHLVLKDTYLIESCPMNPSSPYFMQELNSTLFVRYYATVGAESVRSLKKKRYTSYVDNLHNFMMASITDSKSKFIETTSKYYKDSVTNPIDMKLFTEYSSKYYDFMKIVYQKEFLQ